MERTHLTPLKLVTALALAVWALWLPNAAEARQGEPPKSRVLTAKSPGEIPTEELPFVDAPLLLEEQMAIPQKNGRVRFAVPFDRQISPETHGLWEELADGGRLWRYRFNAPGATSLNFGFSEFWLPEGATLHILAEAAEAKGLYEGPYHSGDHQAHGKLWTPPVPGSQAVLELYLPPGKDQARLNLQRVSGGFHDLFKLFHRNPDHAIAKRGPCNVNVVCPEGDPWRNQIRSVAAYTLEGIDTCSGQMVRDTASSFRNLFLTAFHCFNFDTGVDLDTLVLFWNFESPNCGDAAGGDMSDSQVGGGNLLASRTNVDFALVELNSTPNPEFGVFWAGWDRTDQVPSSGAVAIHHPMVDEKSISFENDPLGFQPNCIIGGSVEETHWRVNDWDLGTTEGGSSGSALFNADNGKVIGWLSGGLAACGNDQFDCYGRMAVAWGGGVASSSLGPHLDPGNTGAMMIDGSDPQPVIGLQDFTSVDTCGSDSNGIWEPGETIEITPNLVATGPFTGITGTLTASSPGITIVNGTASWPDMDIGSPATPPATPFSIRLAPDVGCFTEADLQLEVNANEGGPFMFNLREEVGEALAPVGNVPIPDGTDLPGAGEALISTLEVATDAMITDLDIRVVINHTWVGDLTLQLTSPSGTTVTLIDQAGVDPAMPADPGCNNNNMDVIFDDNSTVDPETVCADSSADMWPVAVGAPAEALAAFNGESTLGTWTLTVIDNFLFDTGNLVTWELLSVPEVGGQCEVCGGGPVGCVPTINRLCLNDDRFAVEADFRFSQAGAGAARGTEITGDTGFFTFLGENNVELVLKVLDACNTDFNSFWVFAAGLTDGEVEIRVTDTQTNTVRVFDNPEGQAFQPLQDTRAFETCGSMSGGSAVSEPLPSPAAIAAELGQLLASAEPPAASGKEAPETAKSPAVLCTPTAERLCLNGGRFAVQATWERPNGDSGQAMAIPLTSDTGFFWFFNDQNLEAIVKVLDGCRTPFETFWVFAAGLTNVEVTLQVTDTATGEMKEYRNPQGTPFAPIQDTQAFATCP